MSIRPHYLPHVKALYDYLAVRVKNDLTLINAERLYEGSTKLELSAEQLEEIVVDVLNYIHDTEEFAEVIMEILSEKAEVGSNG